MTSIDIMKFYRTVQELHKQVGDVTQSYDDISPSRYMQLIGNDFPCHFGQKKLFYALLEFLVLCTERFDLKECLLVYVGAAPCDNINVLLPLFPELTIDLYDPARFHVRSDKRVTVFTGRQGFVTDRTLPFICQRQVTLRKRHILFMSDIRLTTDEKDVWRDMQYQEHWARTVRAAAVCLKFRAPYEGKSFDYIKGSLYFQIRAPVRSAELRLIAFSDQTEMDFLKTTYDSQRLDALINHHNIYVRTRTWKSPAASSVKRLDIGLNNDYEGAAEYNILKEYLKSRGLKITSAMVLKLLKDVNANLVNCTKVDTSQTCQMRTMTKWLQKHKKDLALSKA